MVRMALSKEWTEWHLTPRGWECGSTKTDFASTTVERPPPADRVLTVRFHERVSDMHSKAERWIDEEWQADDVASVKALLERFGPAPEQL